MNAVIACDIADASYKTAKLPTLLDEIVIGAESCQVRICQEVGIIISPAGTNDKKDWKSNGKWAKANFHGYGVHIGFLNGWHAISPDLRELIRDFAGFPIHASAHSRGAAISQLAGLGIDRWKEHAGNVESLTLFASPRAGTRLFCRALERAVPTITRYETRTLPFPPFRDAVPHMPLKAQGYDHPGHATYLKAYGKPSTLHDLDTYRAAIAKKLG